MTTPETTDYLTAARKHSLNAHAADQIGDYHDRHVAAQTAALISIAESMAVLVGDQARDLREERLRSESLRGALQMARDEIESAAAECDRQHGVAPVAILKMPEAEPSVDVAEPERVGERVDLAERIRRFSWTLLPHEGTRLRAILDKAADQ